MWHCHILDHEDNDMMRPMKMVKPLSALARLDRRPTTRPQGATVAAAREIARRGEKKKEKAQH